MNKVYSIGTLLTVKYSIPDSYTIKPAMLMSFIYKALDKDHQTNEAHGQRIAPPFRLKQVRREQNILSMTIAFLTEPAASEFINRVENWKTIRLNNNEFKFLGWEGHRSILLSSDWKKAEATNRFTLKFLTPTYFFVDGNNVPMPLPGLVWGNLARNFQSYTGVKLPKEFIDDVEKYLTIQRFAIATQPPVNIFDDITVVGFTGDVAFRLDTKAPYYLGQILNILSQWAVFSGVGNKTSYGLGAVEIG